MLVFRGRKYNDCLSHTVLDGADTGYLVHHWCFWNKCGCPVAASQVQMSLPHHGCGASWHVWPGVSLAQQLGAPCLQSRVGSGSAFGLAGSSEALGPDQLALSCWVIFLVLV